MIETSRAGKYRYFEESADMRFSDEALPFMYKQARQVLWSTFRQKVCIEDIQEIFPFYRWRRGRIQMGQVHIKDDRDVRFYRSRFGGCPCYYLQRGGEEYLFLPVEAIVQLRFLAENI